MRSLYRLRASVTPNLAELAFDLCLHVEGLLALPQAALVARLYELAERFQLAITGSSDYHGEGKPNRLAENVTTPEVLEQIIAASSGSAPFYG